MNIDKWLKYSIETLSESNIPTARLDCLVLLVDELDKDKHWILANLDYKLSKNIIDRLSNKILRRSIHEPLAYIRGKSEFYGREFVVNNNTLEPRPETETMIEVLKSLPTNFQSIVDVGTGTGAIAIIAKYLYPDTKVFAIDIDNKCIQVSKENAETHYVNIKFLHGNLLEPIINNKNIISIDGDKWIVLANLPYVPENHTINEAAMFEPKHAIFGGEDGLDFYREMFGQIVVIRNRPSYVLTESLPFQHKELENIAKESNYILLKTEDFIQVFIKN